MRSCHLILSGLLLGILVGCGHGLSWRQLLHRDAISSMQTWDYTYMASEVDSRLSARALATVLVKKQAWEDLATSLQKKAAQADAQLSPEQMTIRLAGIVHPRITKETWNGQVYWVRAGIDMARYDLVQDLVSLGRDHDLLSVLAQVRTQIDNALQELIRIQRTLDTATEASAKFLAQHHYAEQVNACMAADWLAQGIAAAHVEQYTEAIAAFTMASQLTPENTVVYIQRARVLAAMGDYEEAIRELSAVITRKPRDATGYWQRGKVYNASGRVQEALADLTQAITLAPQSAATYHERGVIYEESGQTQEALADFTRAIAVEPQFVAAYYNRGTVHQRLGDYEHAVADFSRAIALNGDDAGAYNNRGVAYGMQSKYPHAVADFSRAIELNPLNAMAYYNRGRVLESQGELQQAWKDFTEALTLEPQLVDAYYHRGNASYALHNFEQAIQDYTQTIERQPQHAEAHYRRGRAYISLGNMPRAVSDYHLAAQFGSRALMREMQERLVNAKLAPGPLDGRLGPRTEAALRQYQATHGLPETGTLDEATIRSLLSKTVMATDS